MGADGRPRVLIVGATSTIAAEVARLYAARGASLLLTGRNPARLTAVGAYDPEVTELAALLRG